MQMLCDVNRGGQVMMLSPAQMKHTVMANHSADSLPHPPVQSHSCEHYSPQEKGEVYAYFMDYKMQTLRCIIGLMKSIKCSKSTLID